MSRYVPVFQSSDPFSRLRFRERVSVAIRSLLVPVVTCALLCCTARPLLAPLHRLGLEPCMTAMSMTHLMATYVALESGVPG